MKDAGVKPLQIVLSHGGLCNASQAKMIETAMSGPVGGVMGAVYIGNIYGIKNIITTDVGGTSFDVGLVTDGQYHLNMEPTVSGYLINVPYAQVDSIGAGGGRSPILIPDQQPAGRTSERRRSPRPGMLRTGRDRTYGN